MYFSRHFADVNFPDLVDTVFNNCVFHNCRFGLVDRGGFRECWFTDTSVDALHRSHAIGCRFTKSRLWYTYDCTVIDNRIIGAPTGGLLGGIAFNPWGHTGAMDFVLMKLCESFGIVEKASTKMGVDEDNYYESPGIQGQEPVKASSVP